MSETVVTIPNRRKTTSIYVDPQIWQNFIKKCKVTGQSTCHVLEAFMYGFNLALPNRPISSLPAVNVNLTVNRVVQRVHRVEREREPKQLRSRKLWVIDREGRPRYPVLGYPDPRDYLYEEKEEE